MRKLLAALAAGAFLVGPGMARAQDDQVNFCAEADRVGIDWQNANTSVTGFKAGAFTMKILSPTRRHISPPSSAFTQSFSVACEPMGDDGDLVRCVAGPQIWLFRGPHFTSAYLLGGAGVATNPGDHRITVSYGTCTKR